MFNTSAYAEMARKELKGEKYNKESILIKHFLIKFVPAIIIALALLAPKAKGQEPIKIQVGDSVAIYELPGLNAIVGADNFAPWQGFAVGSPVYENLSPLFTPYFDTAYVRCLYIAKPDSRKIRSDILLVQIE